MKNIIGMPASLSTCNEPPVPRAPVNSRFYRINKNRFKRFFFCFLMEQNRLPTTGKDTFSRSGGHKDEQQRSAGSYGSVEVFPEKFVVIGLGLFGDDIFGGRNFYR